jgi:NAD(P)H-nitrite reductase large subunit/nitrite reductase/ring-hydroxylating ferredoxin subunit
MKYKIAKITDIKNNSMRPVMAGDKELLLVQLSDGKYYAVDGNCPHEGAPLYTGMLIDEKIVCPWHHACFNCKNGAVTEPPAMSNLKSYRIIVEDENIYVELEEKEMEHKDASDRILGKESFLIIGGGAAGSAAAITLRQEGFNGKLLILSNENHPPYDRTELTKNFMKGNLDIEDIYLKKEEFYIENNIDIMKNISVSSLDTLTKSITLSNGQNMVYDKLLIASGSKPIMPYIPGNELKNIFTVRDLAEVRELVQRTKESKKCVIIGSSFIAMEAASSLSDYDIDITIVTKDKLPFERILGDELGKFLLDEFKDKGIKFNLSTEPVEFIGNEYVKKIKLSNDEIINTDFVLIGIGVKPSTDFINGKTLDDGSLEVDEYLKFTKDVYAAGDLANYPSSFSDNRVRVEHWRTAQQHGKVAAKNMLNKNEKFTSVPFFQTSQLGQNIQYVGTGEEWEEIFIDGEIKENNFIVYYLKNDQVNAVVGAGKDEEMIMVEELFKLNKISEISHLPFDFEKIKMFLSGN